MTWTSVTNVTAMSYSTLTAGTETFSALTAGAMTFTGLGALATGYVSTMTLSSATVHGDTSGSDHPFARMFPIAGYDLGVNFVYRVRNPGDWAVRTDRPIPITSQISDSP